MLCSQFQFYSHYHHVRALQLHRDIQLLFIWNLKVNCVCVCVCVCHRLFSISLVSYMCNLFYSFYYIVMSIVFVSKLTRFEYDCQNFAIINASVILYRYFMHVWTVNIIPKCAIDFFHFYICNSIIPDLCFVFFFFKFIK